MVFINIGRRVWICLGLGAISRDPFVKRGLASIDIIEFVVSRIDKKLEKAFVG